MVEWVDPDPIFVTPVNPLAHFDQLINPDSNFVRPVNRWSNFGLLGHHWSQFRPAEFIIPFWSTWSTMILKFWSTLILILCTLATTDHILVTFWSIWSTWSTLFQIPSSLATAGLMLATGSTLIPLSSTLSTVNHIFFNLVSPDSNCEPPGNSWSNFGHLGYPW
jgi:hypothetical protein